MEYKVIITEAFILNTKPIGEYDRLVTLFTRELGLIHTKAKSVRKPGAKLKGFVYPYRFARFSIIQGREYILKEVFPIDDFNSIWQDFDSTKKREVHVRTLRLLSKLIAGPTDRKLFDDIRKGILLLKETDNTEVLEIAIVLKALSHLGFFDTKFKDLEYKEIIKPIESDKKEFIKKISYSIRETEK